MVGALLAAVLAAPAAVRAQDGPGRWRPVGIAYPIYSTLEGVDLNASAGYLRHLATGRLATAAQVDLTLRLSSAGTRVVALAAAVPGLWPRWRVLARVASERFARFPYYGIGNDSRRVEAIEDSLGGGYYRYQLLRTTAFVAVQRELRPWLRLHLAAQARHYRARPRPGESQLAADLAAGRTADSGAGDGLELRAGVVVDTRDFEPLPSRGVRLEAVAGRSVAAPYGRSYTRGLLAGAVYLPVGRAVIAVREHLELATDRLPFSVMAERLTAWGPADHVGGFATVRASRTGRWLAPERLIVSAEARIPVQVSVPGRASAVTLWVGPFVDVARIWGAGEAFALRQVHGGLGVQATAQFSRGGTVAVSVGHSTDAPLQVLAGTGFAF